MHRARSCDLDVVGGCVERVPPFFSLEVQNNDKRSIKIKKKKKKKNTGDNSNENNDSDHRLEV